ncbi:tetraspanin-8-like [Mugil cephalus]|uniref:tetraspanin-8-like n=1 Tax=Mugil cephalus TaxID=48193 RepID=UPI001FB6B0F5|nr:tetraspanin-8-like [Mugil cephalus]
MGKVNGCLKCVFIIFNSLFVIIGGVLFYGMVEFSGSDEAFENGASGLVWSWVFVIAIIAIPSMGICAACAENLFALKTFAGFMGTGMIFMLICGFSVATEGNEVKAAFNSDFRQYANEIMKHEGTRKLLKSLQESEKCCGLMGAEDWGSDIPQSCACNGSSECKSRPYGTTGPDQVYAKGCKGIILQYIDIGLNVIKGIFFGFSAIALLGLLISYSMIHQIKHHDSLPGGYSMAIKGF